MTCIAGVVAKNRVYLGCDGYAVSIPDMCGLPREDSKIFRVSGMKDALIGFTGSFRAGQILQYASGLLTPKSPCTHRHIVTKFVPKVMKLLKENEFTAGDGNPATDQFLLAYRDKLFQIDTDFQVAESACGYDAVGSGMAYAMGSLYSTGKFNKSPVDRVHDALLAASAFGVGIGPPFRIYDTLSDKVVVYK